VCSSDLVVTLPVNAATFPSQKSRIPAKIKVKAAATRLSVRISAAETTVITNAKRVIQLGFNLAATSRRIIGISDLKNISSNQSGIKPRVRGSRFEPEL
jgi:hypothetical protein